MNQYHLRPFDGEQTGNPESIAPINDRPNKTNAASEGQTARDRILNYLKKATSSPTFYVSSSQSQSDFVQPNLPFPDKSTLAKHPSAQGEVNDSSAMNQVNSRKRDISSPHDESLSKVPRVSQSRAIASDRITKQRPKSSTNMLYAPNAAFTYDASSNNAKHASFKDAANIDDVINQLHSDKPIGIKTKIRRAYSQWGKANVDLLPENAFGIRGMKSNLSLAQFLDAGTMRGLEKRHKNNGGLGGGILAHDMGMGSEYLREMKWKQLMIMIASETVMMLANIAIGMQSGRKSNAPTLVVANHALLDQWETEILKHCEEGVIDQEDIIKYSTLSKLKPKQKITVLLSGKIILATYEDVAASFPNVAPPKNASNIEEFLEYTEEVQKKKGLLHSIAFHRIALDEAQAISNHNSHRSKACRALDSRFRWTISGTPFQNRPEETYAYFSFLRHPDAESLRTFNSKYIKSKSKDGGDPIHNLRQELGKFLIRRTRDAKILDTPILILPPQESFTLYVDLAPLQRKFYNDFELRIKKRIGIIMKLARAAPQDADTANTKSRVVIMITRLRQATNHFLLVAHMLAHQLNAEEIEHLVLESLEYERDKDPQSQRTIQKVIKNQSAIKRFQPRPDSDKVRVKSPQFSVSTFMKKTNHSILLSSKMRAVLTQIQTWRETYPDRKVIVFALFIGSLQMLQKICAAEGWQCSAYHGELSPEKRQKSLQAFKDNSEIKILLSSLQCGGVGLNLTEASLVINIDPWWNEAVEEQAFSRVFRKGQTHNCVFARTIVKDTIDERIFSMAQKKQININTIMNNDAFKSVEVNDLVDMVGGLLSSDEDESEDGDGDDAASLEALEVDQKANETDENQSDDDEESLFVETAHEKDEDSRAGSDDKVSPEPDEDFSQDTANPSTEDARYDREDEVRPEENQASDADEKAGVPNGEAFEG